MKRYGRDQKRKHREEIERLELLRRARQGGRAQSL